MCQPSFHERTAHSKSMPARLWCLSRFFPSHIFSLLPCFSWKLLGSAAGGKWSSDEVVTFFPLSCDCVYPHPTWKPVELILKRAAFLWHQLFHPATCWFPHLHVESCVLFRDLEQTLYHHVVSCVSLVVPCFSAYHMRFHIKKCLYF